MNAANPPLTTLDKENAFSSELAWALKLGRGSAELTSPYGQAVILLGQDALGPGRAMASATLAAKLAARLAYRLSTQESAKGVSANERGGLQTSENLEALLATPVYREHLKKSHPALLRFETQLASSGSEQAVIARDPQSRLSAHFIALLSLLPRMEQREFMQEGLAAALQSEQDESAITKLVVKWVMERYVHTVIQTGVDDGVLRDFFAHGLYPLIAQGADGLNQLLARPISPQLLYLNGLSGSYGKQLDPRQGRFDVLCQVSANLLASNHTFIIVGVGPGEDSVQFIEHTLTKLKSHRECPKIFWLTTVARHAYPPALLEQLERAGGGLFEFSHLEQALMGLDKHLEQNHPIAVTVVPTSQKSEGTQSALPAYLHATETIAPIEPVPAPPMVEELDLDFHPEASTTLYESSPQPVPLPPMAMPIDAPSVHVHPDGIAHSQTNEANNQPQIKEALALPPEVEAQQLESLLQRSHEWEMEADAARFEGQESRNADVLQSAIVLYQKAADVLPQTLPSTELSRLHKKLGETYFLLCGVSHHAQHLESAAAAYRRSMDFGNKKKSPFVWADTQHKLGLALASLGELTNDISKVREAVQAYEAALEVRSLQETPADWACTKNFLGIALSTIGAQENHMDTLVQAVAAYQSALLGYSKETDTVDWAGVQNNLGAALANLGERTGESQYLERAIQAFESALSVISKESMPQDWVMTQSNLAHALAGLGKHSSHLSALEKAIKAYEKVLEVRQKDQDPLDWAMTQNNLGHALHSYSEQANNAEMAFRAVQAFRDTLKAIDREQYPLDWAATQNNLGNALQSLSEQTNDIEFLRQAVEAYEAALEVRKEDLHPLDWAGTQGNLAHALQTLSDKTQDDNLLRRTIIAYKSALSKIDAKAMPINWTVLQNNLGTALRILGERQSSQELLKASISAYTAAQPFFESAGVEPYVEMVRKNLDLARESLAKIASSSPN